MTTSVLIFRLHLQNSPYTLEQDIKLTLTTWFCIAPPAIFALDRSHTFHDVISRAREYNDFVMTEVASNSVPSIRITRVWARSY